MAFYDKAPGAKHDKKQVSGKWEEEGTRYNGGRRSSSGSSSYKSGEKRSSGNGDRYNGNGERRSSYGEKRYSDNGDRRYNGNGEHRSSYGEKRYSDSGDRRYNGNGAERQTHTDAAGYNGPRDRRNNRSYGKSEFTSPKSAPKGSYREHEQAVPASKVPASKVPANVPVKAVAEDKPENLLVGRNPIREALKSGHDLEKLLVQKGELSGSAREIVQMAKEAHVVVQEVDKIRLDELAEHHQGLIAFASAYQYSTVEEILAVAQERNEAPFVILLDGVTDPHNLGAIIRSAECAGAHGVIVPERRNVGLTPAAVKASAGAVEHIKVARVTNLNQTLELLKKNGVWVYALTMDGEDYASVDFSGGVALVVGSEGEGISKLILENSDKKVSLPLQGQLDSLNASVAAGIVMYKVLEGRRK